MTQETIADRRFSLVEVQAAARRFLTDALANVHRVNVVRVAPSERRARPGRRSPSSGSRTRRSTPSGWKRNGPCSTRTATSSASTSGWK